MEPIKIIGNPRSHPDKSGKSRWHVKLEDGRNVTQARWMMMNFLHTKFIPKRLHIHHENEITDDDRMDNFVIQTINDHMRYHNPLDYTYGVPYSVDRKAHDRDRYKNDPAYREKCLAIANDNYSVLKNDPIFVKKINDRNKASRDEKKDDPEYKALKRKYNNAYYDAHKDEPAWKIRKHGYHVKYSQNPEYRAAACERSKKQKLKKKLEAANAIS